MKIQNIAKIILSVSLLATASVTSAAAWPGISTTPSATFSFASTYEPSGAYWDDTNDILYSVSDGNSSLSPRIMKMSSSGTFYPDMVVSGNPEGITMTGTNSYLYIADEDTNSIKEYTSSGSSTGKSWSFLDSDWSTAQKMVNTSNNGLEGLAYIPAGDLYSYGVFLGLQQSTGTIFVGRPDLNTSGSFTYVTQYTPVSGRSHPSDLFYSFTENRLYVLYNDGYVRVLTPSGTYITEYSLPNSSSQQEEGFTLQTDVTTSSVSAFIAVDNTAQVVRYASFPQTYDNDSDGVASTSDCNDADATISSNQTYYRDADGDGLGSATTTSVICSYSVPTGYVTNSSDSNDSDYDNDGVSTSADCNDSSSTVSSYLTVYQDYDGDGLGNSAVSQQVCSLTAPTGYVTNASDTDDSGVVVVPPVETTPTEPTYSVIEYLNNSIDDDGDGVIDEWNTLSNNGVHPIYGSYNANSTSLYKAVVTSVAGATNGAIKVKFADGSGYRYTVLAKGNTSVTSQNGTAYLLVRSGKKYALVNAYTGEVLDSLRTTASVRVHLKTLSLRRK